MQRRQRLGLLRSLGRDNRLFPRKLVVTREGRWIIAVAILLGVGAVNTGNNLLYLVLSLLIAIISISGILSELDLRGVVVTRHYPRELEHGVATTLRAEVHNGKKRHALHLEVDEQLDDDELDMRAGFLLHLGPDERASCFAVVRPRRRGPIQTLGLRLSTTYPFGFARKSIVVEKPAHFLVLPVVADVTLALRGGGDRGEHERSRRAGHGSELRGLRDFRVGDAPRDMHWKVSARRGRPIAREWEADATRTAWVDFYHFAPDAEGDPRRLDRACASVAGVAAALLDHGLAVGLRTFAGVCEPALGGSEGDDQLLAIRRQLAWLTAADRPPPPTWPLDDHDWLLRSEQADALTARIEAGDAVALPGAGGPVASERVAVAFRARAAVATASGDATLRVWLDDDGAVDGIERVEADARGAA